MSELGVRRLVGKFKERMAERKLLPADVAATVGMSASTVTRIVNGETKQPRTGTLAKIAKALELDWAAEVEESEHPTDEVERARKDLERVFLQLSPKGRRYLMSSARAVLADEKRDLQQEREAGAGQQG